MMIKQVENFSIGINNVKYKNQKKKKPKTPMLMLELKNRITDMKIQ